jgi:hypothetical protein
MSSFTVELRIHSSDLWFGLNRPFTAREDAEAYAQELATRWALMVVEWRVAPPRESNEQTPPPSGVVPLNAISVTITLGPITRVYRALGTTAPSAYDAGTSISIATGSARAIEAMLSHDALLSNDKEQPARIVLVEASLFDWHRARYSSGLFASAELDPNLFGTPEIAAELWRRLDRGTPATI